MTVIIHSARLVTDGTITADAWVQMTDAVVTATGTGDSWRDSDAAHSAQLVDAAGDWLTPGFIDIHGHGGGAAAYDDGVDAIATAVAVHRAHGTTRSVLSLVTASVADLAQRARMIAELTASDPLILGSHLEGPFLDVARKGAHTAELLIAPTPADIDTLIAAADGTLRQITLAPELDGGLDAVRAFVDAGVRVAVGHTSANDDETRAAFDAGATLLTHAFNAMNGIHHRAPGPVIAALGRDDVTLEVINDGTHVHPDVVRMLCGEAPGRVALITDAMAAAGAADGAYTLGGLDVTVRAGVARLDDGSATGGSIAGSTLLLDEALRRAVTDVRLPMEQAVDAVTGAPARALGLENTLGSLRPGFSADAVLLGAELDVRGVWAEGRRLS
ncbi:N-acetylglucosamine-6-phosphate deacetylase [Paramicrobacterium fandaimingii]|uniref:N-acetylglucosamine-6-phosphate deacetylase n=1 Tax=Paramicrobacterium fandaimingii TaxID=2708079 RepID=UPI00141E0291|nr:N-acetylglucosamine-6-phosphate deacetylase [Microbacterium fandaimingii]